MLSKWAQFAENTKHNEKPNETCARALLLFFKELASLSDSKPLMIVDLGCGPGRDALYYLKQGHNVLAIDFENYALYLLEERAESKKLTCLKTTEASFQNMKLPDNTDLISAGLSLPFVPRKDFDNVWRKISFCLRAGGRFAGHFFGDKHQWSKGAVDGTFLNYDELWKLLNSSRFKIEHIHEDLESATLAAGGEAFFHTWDIVAKKAEPYVDRPIEKNESRGQVSFINF